MEALYGIRVLTVPLVPPPTESHPCPDTVAVHVSKKAIPAAVHFRLSGFLFSFVCFVFR
jgi:hypothetical protein